METRAWKKIMGLVECDKCRLCEEHREIVYHLQHRCKKLVGTEYAKRHSNTLKVLPIKWDVENGLVPEDTKWYIKNCKRGKVIEKNGKKIFRYWGRKSSGTGNIP